MAAPKATVIIPNFNGRRYLPRLLESLANQTEPMFVTCVVDDASTDDSVAFLTESHPCVRLIRQPRNRGFAAACNAGIRAADTPFVVLLNNDTHAEADWLAEGLRPFEDPGVGAVASLVLLTDPPGAVDSAGDVFSVAGGAIKRLHGRPRRLVEGISRDIVSACGAAAFYRREALLGVGLLDERMESYYEDVDLGLRLAWAGYRSVFAPQSVCHHHLSSSYAPGGWRYHFNSARNAEIVWWSLMPPRLRRRFLPAHLAFLCLQAANKLRQGVLRPYLAGKLEALRSVGHIRAKRRASVGDAHAALRVERIIDPAWWRLHVSSRRSGVGDDQGGRHGAPEPR